MAIRIAQSSERLPIEEMGIAVEEIARRKSFLECDTEDVETLKGRNEGAKRRADPVIGDLYRHFLAHPDAKSAFSPRLLSSWSNSG